MKTQEEILQQIQERKDQDFLGFEWEEYVRFLYFDHAKPFLKSEFTKKSSSKKEWNRDVSVASHENLLDTMKSYMDFAWDKANNCRGISANRSILHYFAWLWLAEEDELLGKVKKEFDENYHHYGKPILEIICDHFGWDWKQWDNGRRSDTEE